MNGGPMTCADERRDAFTQLIEQFQAVRTAEYNALLELYHAFDECNLGGMGYTSRVPAAMAELKKLGVR